MAHPSYRVLACRFFSVSWWPSPRPRRNTRPWRTGLGSTPCHPNPVCSVSGPSPATRAFRRSSPYWCRRPRRPHPNAPAATHFAVGQAAAVCVPTTMHPQLRGDEMTRARRGAARSWCRATSGQGAEYGQFCCGSIHRRIRRHGRRGDCGALLRRADDRGTSRDGFPGWLTAEAPLAGTCHDYRGEETGSEEGGESEGGVLGLPCSGHPTKAPIGPRV